MKLSLALSDRMMYRLKRLQQALRSAMERSLLEVQITGPQYAVLAALEAVPGSSSAALARQCFVAAQTMDEIVRGLSAAGLIRRAEPTQGRAVKLFLTREGRKRLEEAHRQVLAVEKKALLSLQPGEREQLLMFLDRCSSTLEQK